MQALVPIVDIQPFASGDRAAAARVAAEFDAACARVGFVQVVGHGIDQQLIDRMLAQVDAFFAQPLVDKLALVPPHPGINRGYAARGSEALSYSLGLEATAPDLFEAFNIGPDRVPDDAWHRDAPHNFFAPNLWPALPAFRAALTAYFEAAVAVAMTLSDIAALALSLPAHWFRPFVDRSTLTLRVNHYERAATDPEPLAGQMRMGTHTDYGMITVLYADPVPGLQVLDDGGTFRDVLPAPGALLVNLGDLTARWTNDRWRSTMHRVVPLTAAEGAARRRSVALFCDANYDARIECVPTCQSLDNRPRYPPVIAGEHLIQKILGPRTRSAVAGMQTSGARRPRD
ncbi:MAG TPA: 2-oxoglutarate and iron-dependent oxygenase domain-containing protein [Polyangiales bacterium]|jgi:isopenicillin N synthase-like dioxygenase